MPPGRVAPPYSRAFVGCDRGNGGGAGESQEASQILGLLLSLSSLASDYGQASAVKTVHTAHHWLSEDTGFRCVCQRRTHSKLVRHQLQRKRQPVVCPYAGERAECRLCDGHAIENVSESSPSHWCLAPRYSNE